MAVITDHPVGHTAQNLQVGDILLTGVKSQGIVSLAIKLGAFLRGYKKEDRQFSHAALVVGAARIAEAQAGGVRYASVSKYREDDYVVIRTRTDPHDQEQILQYAQAVVEARTKYGFATFVGLAIYCLTGTALCIQSAGSAICSGFVADGRTRAGDIFKRPPFANMPPDLSEHYRTALVV